MKIGVCIRAWNVQNIICDWVKYYTNLGFDKIIIYDNMSEPSIEETLNIQGIYDMNQDSSHIEIIIDTVDHSNQGNVYMDCINKNKDLDWLLLCDADEFIYIKDGTIKDFLNTFSNDTATILINWVVFGTSGNPTYNKNKTIYEQFTKRENYNHFWNIFVKSFIRPQLIDTFGNVHVTTNKNYKMKDVYNNILKYNKDIGKSDYIDIKLSDNTPVVIIHYMTLDFESMMKKYNRYGKHYGWNKNDNKYSLEWYNGNTNCSFKDNNIDKRMLKFM